ncbi:MAG: SpoIIE family protein phosphatase [Thermoguttaceae bacterium]|nr:SpoIIE family protein phosphatase [Thermoguttaceae bacterium]
MKSSSFFIDVDSFCRCKKGQPACGDFFLSKRFPNEGRLVATLSDGLGSGVKANILAIMTATMATRFISAERDVVHSAETIMDALPVCAVRKISYSTFSIVDCYDSGSATVVEEGNPEFLFLRDGKEVELEKEFLVSSKYPDRKMKVAKFQLQVGDRIVLCSDGVTQAGLGSELWKLGWRRRGLLQYVLNEIHADPNVSSRALSRKIVDEATRKEPGVVANDDISAAVFYFRKPRKLLFWTGPPFSSDRDREIAERFANFPGKKAISGGTTANIAARELRREITMKPREKFARSSVPLASRMEGVDLITEGVLTLAKTIEYLSDDARPSTSDAASELADMFLDADEIEAMVGTKINEAHFDPSLPTRLDFRRNLIDKLAKTLREKYLKSVNVVYI